MKNICLVQARLGSKRFPQKIIKEVKNELTVLDILFKRLSKSELIDEIIFCIPNSTSDDKLADFLDKRNINYKRGHPENLVDRYINSLKDFNDCNIIRVTSDCPLVDPFWIDKSIQIFLEKKLTYCSNYTPANLSKFCNGSDIEVFSKQTLLELDRKFTSKKDKEHVTFPLWDGRFKVKSLNISFFIKQDISDIRITLDYPEDLSVLQKLSNNLNLLEANLYQIAHEYRKQELNHINGMHSFNEGWI